MTIDTRREGGTAYVPPDRCTAETACWDVRADPAPGTQVGVIVNLRDPWPIVLVGMTELGYDLADADRLAVAVQSARAWVAERAGGA